MRPELAPAQTALLSYITGASAAAPAGLVRGDARASAGERLRVYANMYKARMVEALEAVYPRLARHLGHASFEELAIEYVGDHPSRNPSLRLLGARLPEWLVARRPAVADLARLEWARADVFDAPDGPVLTLDALRALPPDGFATLPLRLVAAHRLVTVDRATEVLWDAAGTGDAIEPTRASDGVQGASILVWRQDTSVYHRTLAGDEAAALDHAASGSAFGAICEALAATLPADQAAARAFSWLATWTNDGLLAA